jgi:hypothetical protein
MTTRKIFQSVTIIVLPLIVILGMSTAVRAADPPWPWGLPWLTATPWPTPRILQLGERFTLGAVIVPATPVPVSPNIVAPAPPGLPINSPSNFAPPVVARTGDSPTNALSADGGSRSLAAGASVWYRIGSGGDHMEVFLDANPLSGMALSVYAPGNASDPIGQGTLQKSSGRLVWAGGHWRSEGDWLARVANSNPMAVQYTLTSSARSIGKKSCYSYWENYPTGQRVYWTECER